MTSAAPSAEASRTEVMVWFDFGGVISPPLTELFASWAAKTGITEEQMLAALRRFGEARGVDPLAPLELGQLRERRWGGELSRILAELWPSLDQSRAQWHAFGRQWLEGARANPAVVRIAERCRSRGLRTGVLSNNVPEWKPYWRPIAEEAGPFEIVVDSCEVGARKPDERIFAAAERQAGLEPRQCLLIDDLEANCAGARRRGWRAIHMVDSDDLVRQLSAELRIPLIELEGSPP